MFNVCSYLTKVFFVMAAAYALLLIPSRLFHTVHWGGIEPDMHWYIGFALTLCLMAFKIVRHKKPRLETRQLWRFLCEDYPWLKALNFLHTALLLCALMFVSGLLADTTGRVFAYCCDFAGQYELAERVYSSTANRHHHSFAVVSGRGYLIEPVSHYSSNSVANFEIDSEAIDQAVAKVYGPASLQMAERYRSHGSRSGAAVEQVAVLYQKSLAIYRHQNEHAECLRTLPILVCCQFELGDKAGVKNSLSEVSRLICEGVAATSPADGLSLKIQFESAIKSGIDVREAFSQFENRRSLASNFTPKPDSIDFTHLSILLCVILIVTLPVAKRILLSRSRQRWQQQLERAHSPMQIVECSDRLIVLELFTCNTARADSYSWQSLLAAQQAIV
jgi:hypothetical protein